MIKLLVSDYDGTYKTIDGSIKTNNDKLHKFMQIHKFMISTGRNYTEFYPEIYKYYLDATYYSLAEGNVLLDKNLNIIKINTMPYNFIINFKEFYSHFDMIETINAYGDKSHTEIVEYKILYKNLEIKKKFIQFLLKNQIFSYHHNFENPLECHISNPYINKVDAIINVSNIDSIAKPNIYTIGDGYNDVKMIHDFNGYAISGAKQKVKEIAKGKYNSVGELADDIIKGLI